MPSTMTPPPAPLAPALGIVAMTPQPSHVIMKELSLKDPSLSSPPWMQHQVTDRMAWYKGFKDNKKGGLIFDDKELLKKQQGVVKDIMLQLGAQLLSGKLAVRLSLPIRLFEPRSLLDRLPDAWAYAPTLLAKAAHATDAVERMKHVMAFVVAGLHFCVGQSKPFNPILGETYQATMADGTSIYLEHVQYVHQCRLMSGVDGLDRHHPPVCAYLMEGPNALFKMSGFCEFEAHLAGNTIINAQAGAVKLEFANGAVVTYDMPKFKMHGIVLGERMFEFTGECAFVDQAANVHGTLDMDGNGSLFGRTHHDDIRGTIKAPSDKKPGKMVVVSKVTGAWQRHLDFDGVVAWDVQTEPVFLPVPVSHALPSDVRFRADLIALQKGELEDAQTHKLAMEEAQRRDHRLRGHDDSSKKKRSSRTSSHQSSPRHSSG
ncbi:Aste57867_21286 [Aphanomyces stellatus]|uniref:Aste57867_21286 protein n=1 Tax=Aphanomyces stellatus TaxID=120398 RepID=A0A485LIJ3_9STRA|nr:hypothetical protein As57867_021217 [Aphanomyces stellatus]VFT97958.1 Aste57867_21286 [Aphanomyces stellatus]